MEPLDFSMFVSADKATGKKGESKFNFTNEDFCNFLGVKKDEVLQFDSKYLRPNMRKYLNKVINKFGAKIASKTFSKKDAEIFEETIKNCLIDGDISSIGDFQIIGSNKRILGKANEVCLQIINELKKAK